MAGINENYLRLPENYLFSQIASTVAEYKKGHPEADIIRLGIGDVTLPLVPAVIRALHEAVDEMGAAESFKGYGPDHGYEFLRNIISEKDFKSRGCDISPEEIFISDGAKCDCGNIQELFSGDCSVAVCDPVYPVYMDSNVMAGRIREFDSGEGRWKDAVYLPCMEENGFIPEIPDRMPDMIYFCFPNNPTGAVITKERLQEWVDAANRSGSVIIYDAAYEAYIKEPGIPHSIYECGGAETCAIEIRSFSKTAGFTGLRLGYSVVPDGLVRDGVKLQRLWARRQSTKYNGAPYIVQRAGEAVYSDEGRAQVKEQIGYYMENAAIIRNGLEEAGYSVCGGVNAPYIWVRTPQGMNGQEFFGCLLEKANVVGTPGSGFGPGGENYFRLTAFGERANTLEAVRRIRDLHLIR